MAETILRELRVPYNTVLEQPPQSGEVTFLEKNGQPIAAVVSMAEFAIFQRWREEEAIRQRRQSEVEAIEREHTAFQKMLPELLQQYPGQVVAIHKGEVIAVGDQRMDVWQQARQQVNGAPVYVQRVEFPPRIYKMPSRKVIRDVAV
ncbi:MAG: hypothetical protein DWI57_02090 [Chloroflexi bacterium]|nr:MAG: hypothetical protein DWI57_02090 [Chloroflexota bacterium]